LDTIIGRSVASASDEKCLNKPSGLGVLNMGVTE
jgi:hypothetical protein